MPDGGQGFDYGKVPILAAQDTGGTGTAACRDPDRAADVTFVVSTLLGGEAVAETGERSPAQGDGEREGKAGRFRAFNEAQVVFPLLALVGLFTLLLLLLTYVFDRFRSGGNFLPENNLPVLLVTGTVALLLSIATLVIVFARLSLTSWRSALGLPEGSIRAVIALLLIVLFFITAVFLYADVGRNGEQRVLNGITEERLADIPTREILRLEREGVGVDERFNVVTTSPKIPESIDLAQQLVTTVSTLVVAVAAFYFGANSVTALVAPGAAEAAERRRPGTGTNGEDGSRSQQADKG